ncbi:MAG: PAS domain S-box protein [Magnetococcales bacterium]|nr:PAS domain S-box protein [Magnetococcales bacterium]
MKSIHSPRKPSWIESQFYSSRARHATIPFVVIVGLLLSFYTFSFLEKESLLERDHTFSRITYAANSTFSDHINQLTISLISIAGLYEASEFVDASEFHRYVPPLLKHMGQSPAFLVWIPVSQGELPQKGNTTPTQHDYYLKYIEPASAAPHLKDKDWHTDPILGPLMANAKQNNQMVVSNCMPWPDSKPEECHIIFLVPIFDKLVTQAGPGTFNLPQTGFIAAGLNLTAWMDDIMSPDIQGYLRLWLIDDTDSNQVLTLYNSSGRRDHSAQATAMDPLPQPLPPDAGGISVTLGSNHWRLITHAKTEHVSQVAFYPWFALVTGLFITLLIALYLHGMAKLFQRSAKEQAFSERLFDVGLNGKMVLDKELRITICNDPLVPLIKKWDSGILGRRIEEIEEFNRLDGFAALCHKSIELGSDEFMPQVTWYKQSDEQSLFIDVYITPLYDGMGHRTGCLVILQNISEHVHLNKRLRLEKDMTRQYLDMADTIIMVLDFNGNIHFINQKGLGILGYTMKDLLGKNLINDLIPEHWRSDMIKSQRRLLESKTNKSVTVHTQVITHTRTLRTVAWKVGLLTNDQEENDGLLCVGEDVTLQVRTEDRLRRSEARFRMMASTAQDAIVEVNRDGIVRFWNTAAEKMFGYSDQEALGKNLHQLVVPAAMLAKANASFAHFFTQKKHLEPGRIVTLNARRKNGVEFPVELSISLMEHRGEDQRVVGIVRDITERKRAEEQDRFASFQAGVADMSVSVLHNIGNAMMSLMGRSEDITHHCNELERLAELFTRVRPMVSAQTSNGTDPAAILHKVVTISDEMANELKTLAATGFKRNALHIREATEHVRDIIRIQQESSHYTLKQKFVLKDLIDDCRVILMDLLSRDQIQLTYIPGEGVHDVHLPRGQMLQMMINLVKNACEAIADPQHDLVQPGRITITSQYIEETFLEIAVEDNGIGMTATQLTKIFSSGYSSKSRGSGFGLHSAANFVQHMGGSITGHSPGPGAGARFVISLPITRPSS